MTVDLEGYFKLTFDFYFDRGRRSEFTKYMNAIPLRKCMAFIRHDNKLWVISYLNLNDGCCRTHIEMSIYLCAMLKKHCAVAKIVSWYCVHTKAPTLRKGGNVCV